MSVVMCSMWRNDGERRLRERAEHLLAKRKSYKDLRFIWVVGDSDDNTALLLRAYSHGHPVRLVNIGKTGVDESDPAAGYKRLSITGNAYFPWVNKEDDYVLVHESDIVSPQNIVNQLVTYAECGFCPVAAWPMIELHGQHLFYDIWAFRALGYHFMSYPPYHRVYDAHQPFRVDSFGTCFLFKAADAAFLQMKEHAVLDLCVQWQERRTDLWVAPEVIVEQPVDLWQWRDTKVVA